jgi:polyhydroxyalkanoate synthesis repressor PhaR
MGEEDATAAQEAKRLTIRKYPNRRYYDSTRSRHLTLEEIYQAIREGYEVEVTDSKTGQDITAKVLAQMIIELDAPKLGVFPVPLLHRLLRANEELVSDFTRKYFSQALQAFLDSRKSFEQSLRSAMGLRSETPTVADWTRMMWGPFHPSAWGRAAEGSAEGATASAPPPPPAEEHRKGDPAATMEQLRREVAELRRKLSGRDRHARRKRAAQKPTKKRRR